ncbi:MAG: hypothetical protein BM557_09625 [Flavobacterium sp. MedPE-SWcel]|uniref:hypothetical protein n=1 Tax=uncultured Flavobacterium sp. TaxID=165435 RepID=UPI00090F9A13|nr:hypothetical protein [uncultured Flavobacterium sp.]OIQ16563.1 MAG: hypothetical protein BM557_09625 [Flavobacterium sp. MedPE-SWcel]
MEKQIAKDCSDAERLEILEASAFKVEKNYSYTRELEQGELQDRQTTLSQNMIKIDVAKQELKEARDKYKADAKPLENENNAVLQEIRTRSEEVVDTVYLLKDEEHERMGVYSKEGALLLERALLPNERQYSIIDNSVRKLANS